MQIVVVFAVVFFVVATMLIPFRLLDSDTLWHIATGQWILAHKSIPFTDPFSWTAAGSSWTAHEWLFEVMLVPFANNPITLSIFGTVLILLGLYFYWRLLKLVSSSNAIASAVLLISLPALRFGWVVRPQLISFLMFSLTLYLLTTGDYKKLRLLPGLFIVWANCHASILLGLVLVGVYTAGSILPHMSLGRLRHQPMNLKKMACIFIACVVASMINPHGYKLFSYAVKVSSDPLYKWIMEWQSPNNIWVIAGIVTGITLVVALSMTRRNVKVELLHLALSVLLFFGVLTSVRHYSYFVILWGALIANLLKNIKIPQRVEFYSATAFLGLSIGLLIVAWPLPSSMDLVARQAGYPVDAANWLIEHKAERIFNHYNYGGYLIYRDVPVFVDGRADMYHMSGLKNDPFKDWVDFLSFAVPPEKILDKYKTQYVLLPVKSAPVMYLEKCGWKRVHSDKVAVVLERKE